MSLSSSVYTHGKIILKKLLTFILPLPHPLPAHICFSMSFSSCNIAIVILLLGSVILFVIAYVGLYLVYLIWSEFFLNRSRFFGLFYFFFLWFPFLFMQDFISKVRLPSRDISNKRGWFSYFWCSGKLFVNISVFFVFLTCMNFGEETSYTVCCRVVCSKDGYGMMIFAEKWFDL